ncbi:sodium/calcium exchanger membrane protein [Ktedonobacter sp. SOSP1-52]|uniref:sodium:calcium antiporter n=1 Tax=Ktedonobacter sp. SOSP1-52 TaxID=2778366 RepID=UPI001915BF32|nr:sodium:calcium antiporter [Ktedonobacter sp. SOSP1-52]GHO70800.1 sodium/calcium exchanger membrane protein [Ktedonobacter sp. SOSP1-52]
MLHSLPLLILILIFVAAAAVVWLAGVYLSSTTDEMDDRFKLGQALGGMLFLAITTNLPEIAITASAALSHNLEIAVGNILGGIAIQTVVLVLFDVVGLWRKDALSYYAASLQLILEGSLVVAVLFLTIMGTQLPPSLVFLRVTPATLLITITWVVGVWLIGKARKALPWQEKGVPEEVLHGKRSDRKKEKIQHWSTVRVVIVFLVAALFTLVAGVALEESGNVIANQIGMSGVVFGSTILALATALPEISTGLASIRLKSYNLAFSDIFGGNAFLPVLFLLATLLSGEAVLPKAQKADLYLAALGGVLTIIYIYGLIFRPKRQILHMGIDSLLVLICYVLGILGLVTFAR